MKDCLFCKIIKGEIPCEKIYEDEQTFAFLDIKPLNEGHTLVIPKEHHTDMTTVPENVFLSLMKTVYKLAPTIKNVSGADGLNLGINNGAAAGQVIFHLHAHIIPRKLSDGYHPWHRDDQIKIPLKETQAKILTALSL